MLADAVATLCCLLTPRRLTAVAPAFLCCSPAAGPVQAFLDTLPAASGAAASWDAPLLQQNEALLVPTQVNYVCKAANLYEDAGYEVGCWSLLECRLSLPASHTVLVARDCVASADHS